MKERNKKANRITAAGVVQIIAGSFIVFISGMIELLIRIAGHGAALLTSCSPADGSAAASAGGVPMLLIISIVLGVILILRGYFNYKLASNFRRVAKAMGESTHVSFINLERQLFWKRSKLLRILGKQQKNGFWPDSYIDMTNEAFVLGYNPIFVKAESGDTTLDEMLTGANSTIHDMAVSARRITDANLRAHAEHLTDLAGQIYTYVGKNPDKAGLVRRLTNYFLPTTAGLLAKYVELQNQAVKTDTMAEAMEKITEVMTTLEDVYKNQLDALHNENVMDVDVEIEVLQNMAGM